jgi:hypothetical protein
VSVFRSLYAERELCRKGGEEGRVDEEDRPQSDPSVYLETQMRLLGEPYLPDRFRHQPVKLQFAYQRGDIKSF